MTLPCGAVSGKMWVSRDGMRCTRCVCAAQSGGSLKAFFTWLPLQRSVCVALGWLVAPLFASLLYPCLNVRGLQCWTLPAAETAPSGVHRCDQ